MSSGQGLGFSDREISSFMSVDWISMTGGEMSLELLTKENPEERGVSEIVLFTCRRVVDCGLQLCASEENTTTGSYVPL